MHSDGLRATDLDFNVELTTFYGNAKVIIF